MRNHIQPLGFSLVLYVVLDAMHGWFQGEFDPSQFDKDTLEELKNEYGDGPVVQEQPTVQLYIELNKPLI